MRASFIGLSALALAAAASPALAADAPAATPMFTLTGSAALVSDYRFRGISQTNLHIAPQASATLTHSSGAYISFWSSAVSPAATTPGSITELDLIAGYSKTYMNVTFDGGLLYYVYPSADKGVNSDFLEIYGSAKSTFGPVTVKGGFAFDPKQKAIVSPSVPGFINKKTKNDNLYLYAEASGAIPGTPFSISSHLGYSKGRSFLTAGLKDYWDWNIGPSYTWKNATFAVSYVDTDIKKGQFVSGTGKNLGKAGVVGSVTYAF